MGKKRKRSKKYSRPVKRRIKRVKIRKRIIFFVIDGMADLPINNKTPLSEACTPNMDFFAANGVTGELDLLPKKWYPTSQAANISLLGYNPNRYYIKRGPLEAVGADIPYTDGHLALRCNFATVDKELKILDRRVGRNFTGLDQIARYVNQNVRTEIEHIFMRTYGHRAVLIFKEKLNPNISDSDPGKTWEPVKKIMPLERDAELSAKIVQDFLDKARQVMEFHPANENRIKNGLPPANYILTRDAGNKLPALGNFVKKHKLNKAVVISENGVMKATCLLARFNAVTIPELNFESSLKFIFDSIDNLLPEYDLIYVHIKGPDEPGHDGDFHRKVEIIERIDSKLSKFRDFGGIVVITCDHITSCKLRDHVNGAVPVLVYGKGKDKVKKFDEMSVKNGRLKNYNGKKLWKFILG